MKKSTQELLDMMKNSRDYQEYLAFHGDSIGQNCMKIDRAMHVLLAEKGLKKADVIARSGLENHYAYQIFSGKKSPTRDKVLMLCFGFCLSVEETQQLLKITGYAPLYSKNERDNVILFGLTKEFSILTVNELLDDRNLDILE